jgi:hypothetical protein
MAVIKETKGGISVIQEYIGSNSKTIEEGDLLILSFEGITKLVTVDKVKESKEDGIEIIYDIKKNHYFNLSKYRKEKSVVLCIYRVIFK